MGGLSDSFSHVVCVGVVWGKRPPENPLVEQNNKNNFESEKGTNQPGNRVISVSQSVSQRKRHVNDSTTTSRDTEAGV